MKQAYTQYHTCLARFPKHPNSTDQYMSRLGIQSFELHRYNDGPSLKNSSAWKAECDVLMGRGYHVYLQHREFCDWLVSQSDSNDIINIEYLSDQVANKLPVVFHFPSNSGLNSFLVVHHRNYLPPEEVNALEAAYSCIARETEPTVEYNSRLACGLGLYLKCFPECLVLGVPEDLKHPSYHKDSMVYSIHLSPKVRAHNGTHTSPCGHFRQGHFRVLRSEWYKKKRYQVLFIDETFVNGKAHTVLSPEEVDSSSSSSTSIA